MGRPEHPHVVVVNDNPDFLELMGDLLHDERYPVTLIDGDRENAVELVEAAQPDALIIDLRLGRETLHGWEVLRQLRNHKQLSQLPTIVCSGDVQAINRLSDEIRSMERVAVLRKPFNIDELFALLDAILSEEPPG
jgi:CheY-like chemotaxis protein